MEIIKDIEVPTGNIYIAKGESSYLEFLSIGDYGKANNIKADFFGYTDEINGVEHSELMPLEDKWVITISTQSGCAMNCQFCDCPKVTQKVKNLTFWDLVHQVCSAIIEKPYVHAKRVNLHYARMGEPTFNMDVINATYYLKCMFKQVDCDFHPVVSTMMPKNNPELETFLLNWLKYKQIVDGDAGLQISVNTTDRDIRSTTIPMARSLDSISEMFDSKRFKAITDGLKGRKITLNFALTDAPVDAEYLRERFDPEIFLCKLTPMHKTNACVDNDMLTKDGYEQYCPYKDVEESLKAVGYDVIVFVPSKEEDKSRITCGNAILSDVDVMKEISKK